ncbi:hypothetical protein E2C01_047305 [Portunus trituberculatus]|uniref:Uncharacterized protein n=1 Tax=Portunus trituberculatus TaxID=210409 RepID=A0A5B7GA42_PORTR|nr:hypothetical protein [Portunus trituberculatus]
MTASGGATCTCLGHSCVCRHVDAAPRGSWRRLTPHAQIYYVTKNIFKRIYRHKHLHVHKYSSQPISQPCVERREDLLSRTLSGGGGEAVANPNRCSLVLPAAAGGPFTVSIN